MLPIFRQTKLAAFATVTSVMGEPAVWETTPAEVAGVGLFKDPTAPDRLVSPAQNSQGVTFGREKPEFRFAVGQFPGLYEKVRKSPTAAEVLRLSDGRRFLVGAFEKKFDGETYVALLEPITR